MDITYCARTLCAHLDCVRHQYHAPLSDNLSIADLNDGRCFDPMEYIPDDYELPGKDRRERLLKAICKGTQKLIINVILHARLCAVMTVLVPIVLL